MKKLAIVLWFVCLGAGATEYEDCILDKMPGTANDTAAYAINRLCEEQYPRADWSAPATRTGWFAYKSGAECMVKKGKDTPSRVASQIIQAQCNRLYQPKNPFDQFDN